MEESNRNPYDKHINMYPPGREPSRRTPYPMDDNLGELNDSASSIGSQPATPRNIMSGHNVSVQSFGSRQYPGSETGSMGSKQSSTESLPRRSAGKVKAVDNEKVNLSEYSEEALKFREVYERTVNDASSFTKEIQLKWCETLLQFAFKPSFLIRYNINAERLRRDLTPEEMHQNQRTILEHALRVLTKLVHTRYSPALYLLGTLFSHQPYLHIARPGDIVGKNDQKALDYYKKAADLGHKDSIYRTGVCFEYGRGVDYSKISEFDSLKLAREYYEKGAITRGLSSCMYKLGMVYLKGLYTSTKATVIGRDIMQSLYWFRMAIAEIQIPANAEYEISLDQVSPQAMIELGKIYGFQELDEHLKNDLLRNGIRQDVEKSIKYYYRCAHDLDYSLAQFKLGHFYEFGEMSLPVMANKSIAWYGKSSMNKKKPNPMAMIALSGWYLTGAEGILQPNDKEAFKWALQACKLGEGKLAKAEYALAFYLERGIGCPPDHTQARKHYEIAAKLGHPRAIDALRRSN